MNLAIYADESGTHDKAGSLPQSEVAVMAGYVGKKESWIKFLRDWYAALNKYGVKRFHFTQLQFASKIAEGGGSVYQKGNPYFRWSKQQCEDFLLDCAKVASAGSRLPVGADFDTRRYSQSTIPEPLRMENPHAGAVWMFYESALEQVKAKWPNARGPITFCFDQTDDPKWQIALQTVHGSFRRIYEKALPRIGGITFGDSRDPDYYGLQAADLLAGRLRQLTRLILNYDPAQDVPMSELDRILFGKFGVANMREILSRRNGG